MKIQIFHILPGYLTDCPFRIILFMRMFVRLALYVCTARKIIPAAPPPPLSPIGTLVLSGDTGAEALNLNTSNTTVVLVLLLLLFHVRKGPVR